jgi:hypothetical protein
LTASLRRVYAEALARCHARGQRVVGYVDTSFGARPLAAVRADIDAHYARYPSIDGVFLEQMSTDPATRGYYQSLYAYIGGNPGAHEVVGNPGLAAATAWQLDTPVADVVTVFEGSAAQYLGWTPPAWVRDRVASQISNLVYSAPDEATMRQVCARSKTLNAGSMDVTDDALPNPWDTLPAQPIGRTPSPPATRSRVGKIGCRRSPRGRDRRAPGRTLSRCPSRERSAPW